MPRDGLNDQFSPEEMTAIRRRKQHRFRSSSHRVLVRPLLRDDLKHVPVLNDLVNFVEAEWGRSSSRPMVSNEGFQIPRCIAHSAKLRASRRALKPGRPHLVLRTELAGLAFTGLNTKSERCQLQAPIKSLKLLPCCCRSDRFQSPTSEGCRRINSTAACCSCDRRRDGRHA